MAGQRVLLATPGLVNPVLDASEVEVEAPDRGRVVQGAGFAQHGEPVRLERDARGRILRLWHGGMPLQPEAPTRRALLRLAR